MNALVLLTSPGCHLCAHGRQVLDELGVLWREVDAESEEGRGLGPTAPPLRPVLFDADGRVVAYGRLSLRRLRREIRRGRVAGETNTPWGYTLSSDTT